MKRFALLVCLAATLLAQRSSQPPGERIAVLEDKVNSLNSRLDKLDAKLDKIDGELTDVKVELGKINTRLDSMNTLLTAIVSVGGAIGLALLGGIIGILVEVFKKKSGSDNVSARDAEAKADEKPESDQQIKKPESESPPAGRDAAAELRTLAVRGAQIAQADVTVEPVLGGADLKNVIKVYREIKAKRESAEKGVTGKRAAIVTEDDFVNAFLATLEVYGARSRSGIEPEDLAEAIEGAKQVFRAVQAFEASALVLGPGSRLGARPFGPAHASFIAPGGKSEPREKDEAREQGDAKHENVDFAAAVEAGKEARNELTVAIRLGDTIEPVILRGNKMFRRVGDKLEPVILRWVDDKLVLISQEEFEKPRAKDEEREQKGTA